MPANYQSSFSVEFVRFIYSFLIALLVPITFLIWMIKKALGKDLYGKKGLNRYAMDIKQVKANGLLIHCVSVGEVVAAAALIRQIMLKQPQLEITISTTTVTGAKQVEQLFGEQVNHLYLPLDLPFFMQRLLEQVKPCKVLITEVELWPNLIHCCWKKHIQIAVINARMTDKSMGSYQKLNTLFQPMLHKLTAVCAQGERDFNNYLSLGIEVGKLELTNNIKFDQPSADELNLASLSDLIDSHHRLIIVAGSTHEPEEQILIEAYQQLKPSHPNLLLMIVPRHPQRFDKVQQICQKNQLSTLRYTQQQKCSDNTDVVLIDAMGLLNSVYAIANIAFVGGSIADRGGHNALEPANFAVPILMGPYIYNNPVICQTLKDSGALIQVTELKEIVSQCDQWLTDTALRNKTGKAGMAVLKNNRGAVAKTMLRLSL